MFCRPTVNSIMRNQNISSGHFFNAISRWAIWYRTMRLTESIDASSFKASLNEFIEFDKTISVDCNYAVNNVSDSNEVVYGYLPLGKPQKQKVIWNGEEFVPMNYVLK